MQSLFLSDVELGKKDDDHRSSKGGISGVRMLAPSWSAARVHPRKLLKRLLLVLIGGLVIYTFIRNIPTDIGVKDRRRPIYGQSGADPLPRRPHSAPSKQGSREIVEDVEVEDVSSFTYGGPVTLDRLFPSLRNLGITRGSFAANKNVLFMAASLKSMTTLLPTACQMGSELRNHVHFAVVGRSEIDIEELQQMNGIDDSCRITFHGMSLPLLSCLVPLDGNTAPANTLPHPTDGRPDYASISTETRIQKSVNQALSHTESYIHTQAIIVDGSSAEEPFLMRALHAYEKKFGTALIELPEDSAKRFSWLAKLDALSLTHWNKITIDILVHAHAGASGSLIRLLKSLSRADFGSLPVPHLTIELPPKIDPPTEEFLSTFQWPPVHQGDPLIARQLSLRHRIANHGISERDSSIRFLESFWPVNPQNSHVLVLSPQAELAEDFYHYITYTLLEYRYSSLPKIDKQLFGLSLELPSATPDGTKLSPPASLFGKGNLGIEGSVPFLWQVPNSNAALFLGERWVDLHGFVSLLLDRQPAANDLQEPKLVNKKYPSWLEYALQLCRARGYWMLYPGGTTAGALATIHNELYQPPEEYEESVSRETKDDTTGAQNLHASDVADTEETSLGPSATLLDVLPESGSLPPFSELPLLTWEGKQATLRDVDAQAAEFARTFQRTVGGCPAADLENLPPGTLFCVPEE